MKFHYYAFPSPSGRIMVDKVDKSTGEVVKTKTTEVRRLANWWKNRSFPFIRLTSIRCSGNLFT